MNLVFYFKIYFYNFASRSQRLQGALKNLPFFGVPVLASMCRHRRATQRHCTPLGRRLGLMEKQHKASRVEPGRVE